MSLLQLHKVAGFQLDELEITGKGFRAIDLDAGDSDSVFGCSDQENRLGNISSGSRDDYFTIVSLDLTGGVVIYAHPSHPPRLSRAWSPCTTSQGRHTLR